MITRKEPDGSDERVAELSQDAVRLVPSELYLSLGAVTIGDEDGMRTEDCLILLCHHAEEDWTIELALPLTAGESIVELTAMYPHIAQGLGKKGGQS